MGTVPSRLVTRVTRRVVSARGVGGFCRARGGRCEWFEGWAATSPHLQWSANHRVDTRTWLMSSPLRHSRPSVTVGSTTVGPDHEPFVIAEISGNHNGDLQRALDIVDAA